MNGSTVPMIAIDGPTASGKGTIAARVAARLGWHLLDSGALYRLTALACLEQGISAGDEQGAAAAAAALDVRFVADGVFMGGRDVSADIRREEVGNMASQVAVLAPVRAALLDRQRAFRCPPGLVADGRDMGTVVFPDADLKIFLVASAEARAQRRYKQLIEKGFSANLLTLLRDLEARDARDTQRANAPLAAAHDALVLDSSHLTIDQTVEQVMSWWGERSGASRS
ncbi:MULTISPECIES: (d)CMP kinase [unclassified Pigmentiphaga]|uniref:(d)CMP kinase n=1 Tax=unclassified Pigmentiphaga TaxID=2626614 RepID=UPI000B407FFA|nr:MULTISPECIES: (d)CMP kinase [unclassified Pigmentiphaga]OVZ66474.1 cytidylate kinase [Pigmentiphaga sp. NML030171]